MTVILSLAVGFTLLGGLIDANRAAALVTLAQSSVALIPMTFWAVSRLPKSWTASDWERVPYTWAGLGLWTNYHEKAGRLSATGDRDADFKRRGEAEQAPWGGFNP
ncbi:MAG: hypothetical protein WBA67_07530 [Jannaschia sp.]